MEPESHKDDGGKKFSGRQGNNSIPMADERTTLLLCISSLFPDCFYPTSSMLCPPKMLSSLDFFSSNCHLPF